MLRDKYMGQKAFDFWRKHPLLDGIEADSWEETMVILLMENQRVIHECSLMKEINKILDHHEKGLRSLQEVANIIITEISELNEADIKIIYNNLSKDIRDAVLDAINKINWDEFKVVARDWVDPEPEKTRLRYIQATKYFHFLYFENDYKYSSWYGL